eukprot:1147331-Pelagomonas_calceolata.AAC.6
MAWLDLRQKRKKEHVQQNGPYHAATDDHSVMQLAADVYHTTQKGTGNCLHANVVKQGARGGEGAKKGGAGTHS